MAFNIHNRSLLSLMHHSERELQYLLDLSATSSAPSTAVPSASISRARTSR